jgi:hypothetical protein
MKNYLILSPANDILIKGFETVGETIYFHFLASGYFTVQNTYQTGSFGYTVKNNKIKDENLYKLLKTISGDGYLQFIMADHYYFPINAQKISDKNIFLYKNAIFQHF